MLSRSGSHWRRSRPANRAFRNRLGHVILLLVARGAIGIFPPLETASCDCGHNLERSRTAPRIHPTNNPAEQPIRLVVIATRANRSFGTTSLEPLDNHTKPSYADSRTISFGLIVTTDCSFGKGPSLIIRSSICTICRAATSCCRSIVVSAGSVQSAR